MFINSVAARWGGIIAGGVMLAAVSTPGAATVVYNNLGPGDSHNPNIGWGVNVRTTPSMRFATTGSGLFSQLTIAVGNAFDSSMKIYLQADDHGRPGAILEILTFNLDDRFDSSVNGIQVVPALGTTSLTENTLYWLTGLASADTGWYWNNTDAVNLIAFASDPFGFWSNPSFQTLGAFRIEAVDVAEPGTLALLAVSLIGLASHRRRVRV
jgi:hypothetical protein